MIRVFVSSCDVDSTHPAALLHKLREGGFGVLHSPRKDQGAMVKRDSLNALDQTDIFIIAVTENWQFSTWMQHEAWEAQKRLRAGNIQKLLFYNPEKIEVTVQGMLPLLHEPLPDDLEESVLFLRSLCRR